MPWEPIRAAVKGSRLIEAAKAPGAAGTAYDEIVERLTQGGMRFATDPFYKNSAAGNFWEALKTNPIANHCGDSQRTTHGRVGTQAQGRRGVRYGRGRHKTLIPQCHTGRDPASHGQGGR